MLSIFKTIYQIFRCVREFVLSLFFILFVLICFALVSLIQSENVSKKPPMDFEKGALKLNLDGYLSDNHDEFGDFRRFLQSEVGATQEPAKISTFDVARTISRAQNDPKISGLVLDLTAFGGGDLPSLEFVGKYLQQFKTSQKPIIAIGEHYSQQQYYLASFADKIYLNQAGFVDLHGLNYTTLYFKSLLEKIEAVPHIFRVGSYKSAVEPFLRDEMSPEARQNASQWLNLMWQQFSETVAKNRQIPTASLLPAPARYLAEFKQAQGDDAQYALNRQLVSELVSHHQLNDILARTFGEDPENGYRHIDFFDYSAQLDSRFEVQGEHKIAVINIEGEIVWGESDESSAGSDTIVPLLQQALKDEQVSGVILRINSPGGSAMASELIRQQAEALQLAGKPVVASMGGMSASGGYWIAATSDKIIASRSTLTGSIGIFGLALNFEKTAQKFGVREDGIATSPFANQSMLKPLSDAQADVIQLSIESGYERFLSLVSRGRNMPKAAVDKVAQGQVWLGQTALSHGLVDQIGDFDDAYTALSALINQQRQAQGKAPVANFALQWLIDEPSDLFSQLLRDFKRQSQFAVASWLNLPQNLPLARPQTLLNKFNDPKQRYLYCLNCGVVR